jgi:hypothetical protein
MFKLDDNFLIELGLGTLPPADKNKMLAHIYETLEMRVGMRLAERMSNEQLDEFESFIKQNDEGGALKWLESNFPNYKQVVAEELEKLKGEITHVAPQIVQQAMTAQTAQPQPTQPQAAAPIQPQYPGPQLAPAAPQSQPVLQPQPVIAPAVSTAASATPVQQPQQAYETPVPSPSDYSQPQATQPSAAPVYQPQQVQSQQYAQPVSATAQPQTPQPSQYQAQPAPAYSAPQQPQQVNNPTLMPTLQPQQQNPPVQPYQPPTMTIPAPTTNYDRKQPL